MPIRHEMIYFKWFILIIVVERITEIIVASKIFAPLREAISKRAFLGPSRTPSFVPDILRNFGQAIISFISKVISCGYCTSVWIGLLISPFADKIFENAIADWLIVAIFLHGMSNLYHVFYQLLQNGRVWTFDIMLKKAEEPEEL